MRSVAVRPKLALREARCAHWLTLLGALLVALPLLLAPASARAQPRGRAPAVSVVTFGPGDHAFSRFGHDAIVIGRGDGALVYNFGTFRFDSPWLIVDFLQGRFQYWLSVSRLGPTLEAYRLANRTIVMQDLALTPEQARELATALARNAQPEHRYYKYDYYRDNCATRVRDAIDHVVGGALRTSTQQPAEQTFREHTLRLVADDWPLYLGLHLGLARAADVDVKRWDEAFLPGELAETLRRAKNPALDGRPLVARERVLFEAQREPLPAAPPSRVPIALLVGATLGGLALAFAWRVTRASGKARWAFGGLLSVVGLVSGLLGCVLLLLWLGTDHEIAFANENLWYLPPWALVLVASGPALALGRAWGARVTFWVTASAAALSWLGLAFELLPWEQQDNAFFSALLLPWWCAACAGAWLARRALDPKAAPVAAPVDRSNG